MRIPVVLDTDIGTDIDDTWALVMLLRSPELDPRLVLTATGDTTYRARVACKLLETAGRTDVPVGVGVPSEAGAEYQAPWVDGYRLESYPGSVHEDGVGALIETVRSSVDLVTIIAIGPATNLRRAIEIAPDVAAKCRIVGMYGSIDRGYGPGSAPVRESNVRNDVEALRAVFAAGWDDVLITPLDTCDDAVLRGERFSRIRDADDELLRALMENYREWSKLVPWTNVTFTEERSSTLFDTVAVYLAISEDRFDVESMRISVTGDGRTVRDETGFPIRVAIRWTNLEGYLDHLTERLLGDDRRMQ